ncbi:MAG: L,D-transpeptidase [Syntrophobacteraceae bacterium]|nr:L,D-transpeptidase [Syntrophobacteraceae bacterium]
MGQVQYFSFWSLAMVCCLFFGCSKQYVDFPQLDKPPPAEGTYLPPEESRRKPRAKAPSTLDRGVKRRLITEKELAASCEKNPELGRAACLEILARLNSRDRYYIPDDIKNRRPLLVPNSFEAYKDWTPLPKNIQEIRNVRKFILVVKGIPFIGWYENGVLVGDSHICIGKQWGWTRTGLFSVLEKDINHFSQSYPNAYGEPAWMPFAIRVYNRVWIHAGDVIGGFCSHGCINVPIYSAEKLFHWADLGTPVLILDSLDDLREHLEKPAVRGSPGPQTPYPKPSSLR